MSENGSKKREWVKTAAIVFLSVLLVLTFFSNTIQNYSLPEVATQYVQSGTITAKIRGTGVVESGEPYEIMVTETRKVSGVAVRVGDMVQKGDVLCYLEDSESEELKTARAELEAAQSAYDKALLSADITAADVNAANDDVSAETYRKKITSYQQAITTAEKNVDSWEAEAARLKQLIADFEMQISITPEDTEDVSEEEKAVENAKNALTAAQNELTAAENKLAEVEADRDYVITVSGSDKYEGDAAYEQLREDVATAIQAKNDAQAKYNNAQLTLEKAQQALDSKKGNAGAISSLTSQMNEHKLSLYHAEKELTAAQKVLTEKEEALAELVKSITNIEGLKGYQDAIDKAREKVDELTEKTTNATIDAEISGTVTAINVTAGNSTSAAVPVVILQPEGKGYTMTLSVTNAQARQLSVGDKAELANAWRYDDVDVTLASIKPDTTDPGQKKLLTFDVKGSVVAGQSLSISVGQKSAMFDFTVPNSAIREDNNGKFILIVESKSSPLGNRYVATRVDVEVLASDDTLTAVTGSLYGYEYVITTASAPVEAGKLVRLTEN